MYRLPIHRDDQSFHDRTQRMFRDMMGGSDLFSDFSSRGHQWPSTRGWPTDDYFFNLNPIQVPRVATLQAAKGDMGSSEILDDATTKNLFIEDPENNSRMFRMSFNVKDYDTSDVEVKAEEGCLTVSAKHNEEKDGKKLAKEFCRKIKLPSDVDPEKLTSTLSSDGILTIQAPVPPKYQSVTGSGPQPPQIQAETAMGSTMLGAGPSFQTSMRVSPLTVQMQMPSLAASGGPVCVPVMAYTPPKSVALDHPVFTTADSGRRRMDLCVNLGSQYTPEDIKVKVDGRRLMVDATHEDKDHGRVSRSSMQREFDLAEDIDATTVQAMMMPDGKLTISAFGRSA